MNLSEDERNHIKRLMKEVASIGSQAKEPIDPRVEVLLEVVHVTLAEQLDMDKHYTWKKRAVEDDRFLDVTDIPSADELGGWVTGDKDDS